MPPRAHRGSKELAKKAEIEGPSFAVKQAAGASTSAGASLFPRTSALCIGVITITCRGKVMFTMCSTDLLRDGQIHEFPESIIRLGVDVIGKD